MGSYVMHLCISNIVKKKLNLGNGFLYGSILPDIIKKKKSGSRQSSHFLVERYLNGSKMCLPDIKEAVERIKFEDNEIKLGYIAHLIEDYIWFSEYIPSYAKKIDNERVYIFAYNKEVEEKEFGKQIYNDYYNSSGYIINKYNLDIEEIKEYLKNNIDKEEYEIAIKDLNYGGDIKNCRCILPDSLDSYINKCIEEVTNSLKNLLKE